MECAAQEGGGLYLSAEDATQLSDALQTAYEKPTVPDGRLIVTATAEGSLQDALVRVTDAATGAHVAGGRTYTSSETNPRRIPLEDGRYRVEVAAVRIKGSPKFSLEFEILDGNQIEKTFDYSAGEISVKVTRNGELSDAVVTIRSRGDRTNTAGGRTYRSPSSNPKVMRLAAGTYDVSIKSVEMRNGPEPVFEDVVINGSERTELEFEYTSGIISVETRRADALVDSVVGVIDEAGKNIGGGRTYTSEQSNPKQVVVAPGNYTIRITEIRGEKRETKAQVVAGETTEIVVDFEK